MNMFRSIAAVLLGWALFATASMVIVTVVMAQEGPVIIVFALVSLTITGLVTGLLAASIAGSNRRIVGYILAGLVVLATLTNLLLNLGAEPVWYKVGTLVLTAPSILLMCLRAPQKSVAN